MATKSFALLILLFISPAVYAVDHIVGGGSGWTTGFDYDTWASGLTFTTADTLVFNYGFSHAVDEVSQADYQSCSSSNSISTNSNSPTTIPLSDPGTRYFICPRANHCSSQGMRLTVTVAAGNSTSPSTPTTPSGSPGTPTTTTPSGTRSPSPPPPPNGVTSIMEGRKGMMVVGSSLVVAALFGLMS